MISLLRGQEGVTAVEFGLILVPLILLLTGIAEAGEVMWVQNALSYSVEEAARCGAVNATICGSASQIEAFAASAAGTGVAATFHASTQTCGSDVTASYTVTVSAPYLNFAIPLSAHACYPE